jgi:hypothetical protein
MAKKLPIPKPTRKTTYTARRAVQIALDIKTKWPDYIPRVESTRLLAADGINISQFRSARRVVRMAEEQGRQDLIEKILATEISLYRADEILTKGERVECPTCHGEGHIFKQDLNRKTRYEDD